MVLAISIYLNHGTVRSNITVEHGGIKYTANVFIDVSFENNDLQKVEELLNIEYAEDKRWINTEDFGEYTDAAIVTGLEDKFMAEYWPVRWLDVECFGRTFKANTTKEEFFKN